MIIERNCYGHPRLIGQFASVRLHAMHARTHQAQTQFHSMVKQVHGSARTPQ